MFPAMVPAEGLEGGFEVSINLARRCGSKSEVAGECEGGRSDLMKSRSPGAVGEGKNSHAKTETGTAPSRA